MTANIPPTRTFSEDWNYQLGYYSQVARIIQDNAKHFIRVSIADAEADKRRATDFVVRITGGDIAVRIRRPYQNYRDLTIRSWRQGCPKTELQKIKEGYGQFYLYCWENRSAILQEWILVDLDKLRASGALERTRIEKMNTDGKTKFIFIPVSELRQIDCIVASCLSSENGSA